MSIKSILLRNTTKSILAIIGFLGSIVTIYVFAKDYKVKVDYEIIGSTNVLDFNADVSKLDVYYDSTNLKKQDLNLRIYTIKIINNGNKDLTKDLYDENDPLGIKITSGEIIETPEIIYSSSQYLKNNLKLNKYSKDIITYNQVIIDSKEFFIIKLLILHQNNIIPKIVPLGKIAGQKEIDLMSSHIKVEQSIWYETFNARITIQILRLFFYTLIFLTLIRLFEYFIYKINNNNELKRRKKLIIEYKNGETYNFNKLNDVIFDTFLNNTNSYFEIMYSYLDSDKKLNEAYNALPIKFRNQIIKQIQIPESETNPLKFLADIIYELMKNGMITKDKGLLKVNADLIEPFNKFMLFLRSKKYFC